MKFVGGSWATKEDQEIVLSEFVPKIPEIHHGITVCNIISLITKSRHFNDISHVLDVLYGWVQDSTHKKEHNVRAGFLKLVSQFGEYRQVKSAINNTSRWLLSNESEGVYSAYITLVERKSGREVKQELINALYGRVEDSLHAKENTLRCKYLALVTASGTKEQLHSCIGQTLRWWESHFDQTVIAKFLTLLEQRDKSQLPFAIEKAKGRLSKYLNKYETLRKKIDSLARKNEAK